MTRLIPIIVIILLIIPFTLNADENISDGDLIRATNDVDVYIVKIVDPSSSSGQVKKFKRLILNPEIFNKYGHLKWENIKEVAQSIVDEYTISDLVRAVDDEKVYKLYPSGDIGEKKWIKTADDFLDLGYDWGAVYEINSFERDYYLPGDDLTATQSPSEEEGITEEPESETPTRNPITINVPGDYSTIQAAIDAAINGDTIEVSGATYKENIVLNKNIKLIGTYAESVIVDGQGNGPGISIEGVDDFLIQRFTAKSSNDKGIYCSGQDLSKGKIKHVILKDSLYGLYIDGNCEIDILNSLIFDNEGDKQGGGIFVKDNGYLVEIINNTIDNNYTGIWSENADLKIMNNIITNNLGGEDSYGIYHSGTGEADSTYNNVWQNGKNYQGTTVGAGSLAVDPRFVNATQENYILKSGSAATESYCFDKGHPNYIYNDGMLKGNLYRNDMGAYGGPENTGWTP